MERRRPALQHNPTAPRPMRIRRPRLPTIRRAIRTRCDRPLAPTIPITAGASAYDNGATRYDAGDNRRPDGGRQVPTQRRQVLTDRQRPTPTADPATEIPHPARPARTTPPRQAIVTLSRTILSRTIRNLTIRNLTIRNRRPTAKAIRQPRTQAARAMPHRPAEHRQPRRIRAIHRRNGTTSLPGVDSTPYRPGTTSDYVPRNSYPTTDPSVTPAGYTAPTGSRY